MKTPFFIWVVIAEGHSIVKKAFQKTDMTSNE